MAPLSVQELKSYLRIEHSASDALLARLLVSASTIVESFLHRPIEAVERTFVDQAQPGPGGRIRALMVPVTPLGTVTSITHADGETVDVADTMVDMNGGMILMADESSFRCGPWTIVCTVGLSLRSDFQSKIEPAVNVAIEDVVADLYLSRNPAASQESEGGGVAVSYHRTANGLAPRTEALLRPWRMEEVG